MSKKILITGINGFIGRNCRDFFQKKGCEIFGIDLNGTPQNNVLIGEVDEINIKSLNQNFDVILHFAGSGTVSMAQKAPEVEKTKAVGSTQEILKYIKNNNPNAKLIFSSSAAVYGNNYNNPIEETNSLSPISVYGLHKLEAEKLCEYYANNFDIDIKIIRIFSLYGEGLKKQLLWDFCNRAIKADKELTCFGCGQEARDFIHIKDLLNFIELLANRKKGLEYYNCASGVRTTVQEVMQMLLKELQIDLRLNFDNIKRFGNPEVLIANITKAKSIGFSPQIKINDGIKEYVRWFKNN